MVIEPGEKKTKPNKPISVALTTVRKLCLSSGCGVSSGDGRTYSLGSFRNPNQDDTFRGLCALSLVPAPPPLLPGVGLRTSGPGESGEMRCTRHSGICATFIVLKEALWDRGSPKPQATPSGRKLRSQVESFTEQRGKGRGPTLQPGCPGKADTPESTPAGPHPVFCPASLSSLRNGGSGHSRRQRRSRIYSSV